MVAKKPRIVIVGAGMAGLVAAHKLYKSTAASKDVFELCVVEGGNRIGGRICTSEFGGDQIEMGATWIHGIGGSPIYGIAKEIGALQNEKPWERMDGFPEDPLTAAEDGFNVDSTIVDSISNLYKKLMDFCQGKLIETDESNEDFDYYKLAVKAMKACSASNGGGKASISIGAFLREGLEAYWKGDDVNGHGNGNGNGNPKLLEEAVFAMHENTERTYTSAGDLFDLDFTAEREYDPFPDEEITIAKGYSSIIQYIASVLPNGLIQLGKTVTKIEWQCDQSSDMQNCGGETGPVKLHFDDGSTMVADHVLVTVSLGVLKAGIKEETGMFTPPLPHFKTEAISRLGFGVVNKLFLQLGASHDQDEVFPFLQMAFQQSDSKSKHQKIPWWMRRTTSLCPIYNNSSVLLSWFAGEEALELENLKEKEIIDGVSTTISTFLPQNRGNAHTCSNGNMNSQGSNFTKLLKSQWGTNPLFKGSYSYVATGSSGDDLDLMAKPLPSISKDGVPPLQVLFAGEATHRTHYSTTHGAYFSGIREANRLLQHYQCGGLSDLLNN
ncbi:Amine oxidase [Thalictrum thalictroides]|uniref:Amine oxidase n=1 Tax=Thalictrum thalictroides TaxID=46969 RepID=A0A7J6VYG8_THATH|nr:Amine oxidase [Thalictrum thalictroides]